MTSAVAQTEERAQAYTFAFRDADVAQVIDEVVGRVLGLSYTIDPAVTAKVTFRVDQRLTPVELLETLETTLATYDLAVVRNGESLLITTRANARSARQRSATGGADTGYATETVTIVNSRPTEIATALQGMGSGEVVAYADDRAGILMLGGSPSEIEAARELIATLDERKAPSSRWIVLQNVSADTVAQEMAQLITAMNLTDVRIAALPRLRGLMLFAPNDSLLDQAAALVTQLDTSSAEGDGTLWSYRPKNVAADSLSITLNDVLGNGSTGGTTTPASSSAGPAGGAGASAAVGSLQSAPATTGASASGGADGVRFAVDRESNTLVISSPQDRRPELQRLLQQLDVRPRQVLIEARVLEVTLGDEFRFGVDWSILSTDGRAVTFARDASGAVAPTFPGIAVTYLTSDAKMAIDLLGSRTDVEVVSSPKIIVLDNHSAQLQIGDQVPVATETSQSNASEDSPRLISIQYRDTGVLLNVLPRVTGENDVTLIVTQEVSAVSKTTTSGIDSPTIQQRRFDSSLLLNSGGTVALGGLISSTHNTGVSGVPGLSDIPLIGGLFRSEGQDTRRTELIVLLTATILSDPAASSLATQELVTDMKGLSDRGLAPQ